MRFLFVSRKKYERIVEDLKNNNKIINDERIRVTKNNRELQEENKKLKDELKINIEMVEANDITINELMAENDALKNERDTAVRIQRSETRTRKSKKYKEMEKTIKELQEDLDRTRKEYDELRNSIEKKVEHECKCKCDDELPFADEPVISTEVKDGVIRPKHKRNNTRNKVNNNRKGRK